MREGSALGSPRLAPLHTFSTRNHPPFLMSFCCAAHAQICLLSQGERGSLHAYKFLDGVWKFHLRNVNVFGEAFTGVALTNSKNSASRANAVKSKVARLLIAAIDEKIIKAASAAAAEANAAAPGIPPMLLSQFDGAYDFLAAAELSRRTLAQHDGPGDDGDDDDDEFEDVEEDALQFGAPLAPPAAPAAPAAAASTIVAATAAANGDDDEEEEEELDGGGIQTVFGTVVEDDDAEAMRDAVHVDGSRVAPAAPAAAAASRKRRAAAARAVASVAAAVAAAGGRRRRRAARAQGANADAAAAAGGAAGGGGAGGGAAPPAPAIFGSDEELNSDDDEDEDEDGGTAGGDAMPEETNIVICQFKKVQRTRDQWEVDLTGGIARIDGLSYAFKSVKAKFVY